MKRSKLALTLALSLLGAEINAQNTIDSLFITQYERPTVTVCLLDFAEKKLATSVASNFQNYRLDAKYNEHKIESSSIIQAPFKRDYIYNDRYKLLEKKLNEDQIARKVIEKWFMADSVFSMDLVAQRGVYNASESDLELSERNKRGVLTLKDAGERLIDKSYLLVIDFFNLSSANNYLDKTAVIGYLYKLKWTDKIADDFYTNAWESNIYFRQMKFEVEYVTQVYVSNVPLVGAGKEEEMALLNSGIEAALKEAAKSVSDLKVHSQIASLRPIRANIGRKEGVMIDQKFVVYERILDRKSKIRYKRCGSVRAKNTIVDNTDSLVGKNLTTHFYQDAGKRFHVGMLMEQRYETGLSFAAGWANRSLQGVFFRLDYTLAKVFNWSLFKIFAEIQIASNNVQFGNGTKDYQVNATNFAIGLSKEFIISRNIHLEPSLAIASDNVSYQLNKEESYKITNDENTGVSNGLLTEYQQVGLQLALRIPINILHNFQIVPAIGYATFRFPSEGLFGSKLPANLAQSTKEEMRIDDSRSNWNENTKSDISTNLLKWEMLLRLKF
ncbi:MAG: hypothetical protein ACKVOU_10340 [Cytophagales bacterium]